MSSIAINPVEELIKSIQIVHGKARADFWRRVWSMVLTKHAQNEQEERVRKFCEQQ